MTVTQRQVVNFLVAIAGGKDSSRQRLDLRMQAMFLPGTHYAIITRGIFLPGVGMDVLWVGLIGAIPRVFDAISDPMLGYISDNTRTR